MDYAYERKVPLDEPISEWEMENFHRKAVRLEVRVLSRGGVEEVIREFSYLANKLSADLQETKGDRLPVQSLNYEMERLARRLKALRQREEAAWKDRVAALEGAKGNLVRLHD